MKESDSATACVIDKVRNEFSIDCFGYGYQKPYQEWVSNGAR